MLDVIVFNVVHQMCPITFDLLRGSNGTEYYFRETLTRKHAEANSTDGSTVLDQSQGSMLAAIACLHLTFDTFERETKIKTIF